MRYRITIRTASGKDIMKVINSNNINWYMAQMAKRYRGIKAFTIKELKGGKR